LLGAETNSGKRSLMIHGDGLDHVMKSHHANADNCYGPMLTSGRHGEWPAVLGVFRFDGEQILLVLLATRSSWCGWILQRSGIHVLGKFV